jgi:hypothetical protein
MKFRLSPFAKIASTKSVSKRPIEYPNPVLNVGVFSENMGSMPQVNFMTMKIAQPENINTGVDTSYNNETGKGSVYIPEYKDYYTGEPV